MESYIWFSCIATCVLFSTKEKRAYLQDLIRICAQILALIDLLKNFHLKKAWFTFLNIPTANLYPLKIQSIFPQYSYSKLQSVKAPIIFFTTCATPRKELPTQNMLEILSRFQWDKNQNAKLRFSGDTLIGILYLI